MKHIKLNSKNRSLGVCGFWCISILPYFPLSILLISFFTGVASHICSSIWWFIQNKPYIFWKPITGCYLPKYDHNLTILINNNISFSSHHNFLSFPLWLFSPPWVVALVTPFAPSPVSPPSSVSLTTVAPVTTVAPAVAPVTSQFYPCNPRQRRHIRRPIFLFRNCIVYLV